VVRKKKKETSRQYRWQKLAQKNGFCITCGKPRDGDYKSKCIACQHKYNEWQRERGSYKKWEEGKPGRPPKHKEE